MALPATSWLSGQGPFDYADAFSLHLEEDGTTPPEEILIRLFCCLPGWAAILLRVRNFLARWIGLRGSMDEDVARVIREGGESGGFAVLRPERMKSCCTAGTGILISGSRWWSRTVPDLT